MSQCFVVVVWCVCVFCVVCVLCCVLLCVCVCVCVLCVCCTCVSVRAPMRIIHCDCCDSCQRRQEITGAVHTDSIKYYCVLAHNVRQSPEYSVRTLAILEQGGREPCSAQLWSRSELGWHSHLHHMPTGPHTELQSELGSHSHSITC